MVRFEISVEISYNSCLPQALLSLCFFADLLNPICHWILGNRLEKGCMIEACLNKTTV